MKKFVIISFLLFSQAGLANAPQPDKSDNCTPMPQGYTICRDQNQVTYYKQNDQTSGKTKYFTNIADPAGSEFASEDIANNNQPTNNNNGGGNGATGNDNKVVTANGINVYDATSANPSVICAPCAQTTGACKLDVTFTDGKQKTLSDQIIAEGVKGSANTSEASALASCEKKLSDRIASVKTQWQADQGNISAIANASCGPIGGGSVMEFCKAMAGDDEAFKIGNILGDQNFIDRYSALVNESCGIQSTEHQCIKDNQKAFVDMVNSKAKPAIDGIMQRDQKTGTQTQLGTSANRSTDKFSYGLAFGNGSSTGGGATDLPAACNSFAEKVGQQFSKYVQKVFYCQAISFMLINGQKGSSTNSKFAVSKDAGKSDIRGVDPRVGSCEHTGFSSDYDDCKKLVSAINVGFLAQQGSQVAGQINHISTQNKVSKDLKEAQNGDQSKYLQAGKDTTKAQQTNAIMDEAVLTTQAATIGGIMASFQTSKKIRKRCVNMWKFEEDCNVFNDASINNKMFNNSEILGGATAILTETIGKMAVKGAEIALLQKQLNSLDDYQKQLNDMVAPDNTQNFVDLTMGLCQANPGHPQCSNYQQQVGLSDPGSLNFGNGSSTVLGDAAGNFNDSNFGNTATSGTTGKTEGGPDLGPMAIGNPVAGENGFEEGGSPLKYAANSGTQGGGSSGGAGGGGGGGAFPNSGGGGGQGGGGLNITKSNLGYGASGFKIGGNAGKGKNDNPFDKLFNKEEKSNGGGTLDFRGPASEMGDPGKGLFIRISEGYQKASNKKLLLEYEMK